MLDRLTDPFNEPEFATGLGLGVWALIVCVILGSAWRWRTHAPAPVAGLAVAGAGLVAVDRYGPVSDRVVLAVVLLAVIGTLIDIVRLPALFTAAVAAPAGTWLAFDADLAHERWIGWLLAATIGIGGPLLADLDRRHRDAGLGPTLVAITAGGLYSTLPDTEQALPLLAVALVVALVGWPIRLVSLGSGGALSVVATVATVSSLGGVGRDRSVVAGVFCLGAMLAEPVATRLAGRPRPNAAAWSGRWVVVLGLAHLVCVLVVARVAGLRATPGEVGQMSGAAIVGTVVVLAVVRRLAVSPLATRDPPAVDAR